MAEQTKQALKVENNTNFPNNNTGFITPALLREFNTDMIDSTVNQIDYNIDSASFNEQINALDPSGSAASLVALNEFTQSILGTNAFTASAKVSINALNAYTASATQTATGSLLTTASFSGNTMTFTKGDGSTFGVVIPDVSGSTTTALNQATASLQAFTASVAGTNAFTASIAGTNAFTQSTNTSIGTINNSISAINGFTASNTTYDINVWTGSINAFTASIRNTNTFTQSAQLEINALEAFSASALITASANLNTLTFTKGNGSTFAVTVNTGSGGGSATDITALNNFTASVAGTNAFTASIRNTNTFTQSAQLEINALEAFTASVAGTNAFTASIRNTNAFTQSAQLEINALEAFTASIAGTNAFTASALTTASANLNVITFTKGNGTTFAVTVNTGSGGGGTTDISALNAFTASVAGTNAFTQSTNARLNSIEATTASLQNQINLISGSGTAIAVDALNQFTASIFGTNAFTASIKQTNDFTASAQNSLNSLNAATSSYITSAVTSSMAVSSSLYAVTASFARDVIVSAINDNQSTLPIGTVVRISGATGDNPRFNTASYDDETTSANTLGVLANTAVPGNYADITVIGKLVGIDTDGMNAGDLLYLGANGTFTNVQPQAPLQIVVLGEVLRVQQNNGSMFVNISNGWELNELHNVRIVNPLQGDLLVYEASSSLWKNIPSSSVTPTDISALNAFTASIAGTNTFTQSAQLEINALEAFTASVAGTNAFTASALTTASVSLNTITFTKGNGTTFALTVNTGSGGGSTTDITALNNFTASVEGTNAFTASQLLLNARYATTGSNIFTGASNTFREDVYVSGSLYVGMKPGNGLYAAAITVHKPSTTNLLPINANVNITGSLTASLENGYVWVGGPTGRTTLVATSSFAGTPTNISALNAFSASTNLFTQSAQLEINALEAFTASVAGTNTFTQSAQLEINALEAFSASALITASFTGSTLTFTKGNSSTFGITGLATTSSLSNYALKNSTNTFTAVNSFQDAITMVAGGTIDPFSIVFDNAGAVMKIFYGTQIGVTGNFIQFRNNSGTYQRFNQDSVFFNTPFTASLQSGFAWVGGPSGTTIAVATSSFAGTPVDISALNAFSASTNLFTQSAQLEINALEAFTASIAGTNAFTASTTLRLNSLESTSASVNTSLASLNGFTASVAGTNLFTQSAQLEINALEAFSASALTTASFSGNTLTFTKGNGTTFGVTIPDVSGSTINTGSFATTGSNAFFGNQTISGSVGISGSAITFVSGTLSGSVVTNIGDTFTDVAPVNRIITLTSASYAALASGSTTDPNALYIVSGSLGGTPTGPVLVGNNNFVGNQTITGSLVLSSSAVTELQVIGDVQITGSILLSSSAAIELNVVGGTQISGSSVFTGSVQGNVVSMSISSNTASMDFNAGNFFTITLASGSIPTFINPTNIKAGQTISLVVTQAATLSGSLAFPTTFKFPSGSSYVPSAVTSSKDIVTFITVDTSTIFASSVKNLI